MDIQESQGTFRKWSFPRLKDPRNAALNDLRHIGVGRIHYDADSGEVLAVRTRMNHEVSSVGVVSPDMMDGIRSMAEEFRWPMTGRVVLHLTTMNCVRSEVPPPTPPKEPEDEYEASAGPDGSDTVAQDPDDAGTDNDIEDIAAALWGDD